MKLLQIPNYYYPHIGGIEQVARDIATSFKDIAEQQILCFDDIPSAEPGNTGDHILSNIDGVQVTRCKTITKLFSQSISFSAPKYMRKTFNEFKPDVVIIHYPNPLMTTCLMPYFNRDFKLIVYWHSDIVKQKGLGKLFNSQSMKLLKRADKIVATSPNYIEGSKFLSAFKEKVVVIPNCISTDRLKITDEIRDKASKIKSKYNNKTIGFAVGRHVPYKGFSSLIDAAKLVNDNIQIVLAGSGPLTNQLKKEAEFTNIDFVGRVSDEELVAYFLACDMILFPSITKNEAFGISLAEGMYFGKPAITYTIPGSGVNYVNLKDVTGLECPNQDSLRYAKAINELAEDLDTRNLYGFNAKNRVENLFLFSLFKEKIMALILD